MDGQEDSGIVKPATAPPTREHKKAGRMGRKVLGAAMIAAIVTAISTATGMGGQGLLWGAAGVTVALAVVGLVLEMESERQRQSAQNPAERRPAPRE
jgi:predicted cobalt transporter CbtA